MLQRAEHKGLKQNPCGMPTPVCHCWNLPGRVSSFWGDREGDLVWRQMRSRPLVRKRLTLLLPAI